MQYVKKNLLNSQEKEGVFCRTLMSKAHNEELLKVLSEPNVTYGDIKSLLKKYKTEILNSNDAE